LQFWLGLGVSRPHDLERIFFRVSIRRRDMTVTIKAEK